MPVQTMEDLVLDKQLLDEEDFSGELFLLDEGNPQLK
jgi:hypothetical protein